MFPSDPDAVYNNALFDRDLGPTERAAAVDAMTATYNSAGVDRYAAWVHESDEGMRAELTSRGYSLAESTRAMGMSLDGRSLALPAIELGPLDGLSTWSTCGSSACPPGCSPAPTRARFTPSWRGSPARTSRPRLRSTTMATAACSTCPRSSRHGGEGSAPAHRTSRPRCRRTRLLDRKPAVHRDGRAPLRGGWFPRPRPDPRIRAVGVRPRLHRGAHR